MSNGSEQRLSGIVSILFGAIMLGYGFLIRSGSLNWLLAYLKTQKEADLQVTLCFVLGGLGILVGLIYLVRKPTGGILDNYVLGPAPGMMMLLLICMVILWYMEPMINIWSAAAAPTLKFSFAKIFNLNHVVLGILVGILITNTIGIPKFAAQGVKTARFVLKMGIITLGARYSLAELTNLGQISIWMIGFFVVGTVLLVLWLGKLFDTPHSMTGVLSSGMGVCGVSAAVACAPVVKAKSHEMAYTIGTILLWGVGCMFLFPTIGKILDMTPTQFGSWAGTGILNSAQVAAAALAFNAVDITTLKVAEIFNITRVLFLPLIVLILAYWFSKVTGDTSGRKLSLKEVVVDKFPLFVLGFILMFVLSSAGVFGPAQHYQGKYLDFSYSKRTEITPEELQALGAFIAVPENVQKLSDKEKSALNDLNTQHQIAGDFASKNDSKLFYAQGKERMETIEAMVAAKKIKDKKAEGALKHAVKQVYKDSKTITLLTDLMMWFFAYGLLGLGMQITWSSISQAGGAPLIIGAISGTAKAVLSLIVVLLLIKEAI
jgi:uncharacterized integral membrane protein (TIGR00698 family)